MWRRFKYNEDKNHNGNNLAIKKNGLIWSEHNNMVSLTCRITAYLYCGRQEKDNINTKASFIRMAVMDPIIHVLEDKTKLAYHWTWIWTHKVTYNVYGCVYTL